MLTENDFSIVTCASRCARSRRRVTSCTGILEAPFGELYDLEEDPGEIVNRWDDPAYAATKSDLLALLDDVMNHDVRKEPPSVWWPESPNESTART